jgi:hypothetical protein
VHTSRVRPRPSTTCWGGITPIMLCCTISYIVLCDFLYYYFRSERRLHTVSSCTARYHILFISGLRGGFAQSRACYVAHTHTCTCTLCYTHAHTHTYKHKRTSTHARTHARTQSHSSPCLRTRSSVCMPVIFSSAPASFPAPFGPRSLELCHRREEGSRKGLNRASGGGGIISV